MPAVAVVGAAVAIGVAVEVGTTLAIVAAVGATVAAVGAVTGVRELTIVGGIIGAVGAIGGLASSAGLFGEAASLGEAVATGVDATASPFAAPVAEVSAAAGIAGGETMLAGAPTIAEGITPNIGETADIIDTVSGSVSAPGFSGAGDVTTSPLPDVTPDVTPPVGDVSVPQGDLGLINAPGDVARTAGTPADVAGGVVAPSAPQVTGTPDAVGAVNPLDAGIPGSRAAAELAAVKAGPATYTPAGQEASVFSKIMKIMDSRGGAALLQAGGAFFAGATNELTPAQIEYYETQARQNIAAANLANSQQRMLDMQIANLAAPMPVASRRAPTPVTGQPTGLINQRQPGPPVPPPVTGAPAPLTIG